MVRDNPWLWVPAVVAGLMLIQGSAATMPLVAALCGGGGAGIPGNVPAGDCEKACHSGCTRRKGLV